MSRHAGSVTAGTFAAALCLAASLSVPMLLEGDAIVLLDWFPAGTLSRIDLIYPDPWPKRRHWKRRIVRDETIAALARVLRGNEAKLPRSEDRPAVFAANASCIRSKPGTMIPPRNSPCVLRASTVIAVPALTTKQEPETSCRAPISAAQRSAPSCDGSS